MEAFLIRPMLPTHHVLRPSKMRLTTWAFAQAQRSLEPQLTESSLVLAPTDDYLISGERPKPLDRVGLLIGLRLGLYRDLMKWLNKPRPKGLTDVLKTRDSSGVSRVARSA
jgi:hypothetical protein